VFETKYDGRIDVMPDWRMTPQDAAQVDFDLERLNGTGWLSRVLDLLLVKAKPAILQFLQDFLPRIRLFGILILTRHGDIETALNDPVRFVVHYQPDMRALSAGATFMLGLPQPAHDGQRLLIEPFVTSEARASELLTGTSRIAEWLLESSDGRIDVMKDYFTRIAAQTSATFLGLNPEDVDAYADWTLAMSTMVFGDPFGRTVVRELGQYAAWRFGLVADQAIADARDGCGTGLVAELIGHTNLTDAEIRANLFGLAIGLVPTVTLAAGNVLTYLLENPEAWSRAVAAAEEGHTDALRDILAEASRLKPALDPGQFRYVPNDVELPDVGRGRTRIPAGTVVLVATAQGLRDPDIYEYPTRFDPTRPGPRPNMMFGDGVHRCMGATLALSQMTTMFAVLLRQPQLTRSRRPEGRLHSVGIFPRRLDMEFSTPRRPRGQSMTTVVIPLEQRNAASVERRVRSLGNPACESMEAALTSAEVIHFMSANVIDVGSRNAPDARLLIELNADGDEDEGPAALASAATPAFLEIMQEAGCGPTEGIKDFLLRHRIMLSPRPWGVTGLNYNGSEGFPVAAIARQRDLASFAADALDLHLRSTDRPDDTPYRALSFVRDLIAGEAWCSASPGGSEAIAIEFDRLRRQGQAFRSMLCIPSRKRLTFAEWREVPFASKLRAYHSAGGTGPLIAISSILIMVASLVSWLGLGGSSDVGSTLDLLARGLLAVLDGTLLATLIAAGFLLGAYLALRRTEDRDRPDERDPDCAVRGEVANLENADGFVQNHIFSCSDFKPGILRRLTFAFAMWGIGVFALYWTRPGFILDMGTIHFARWLRLPGAAKLVFLANYDGSWESYLEDFIAKAHPGQSAAWSHGVGFPKTRGLINEGARDGDRFKRWVKRQQRPTQFWYSRFPKLTLDRMRTNGLIHHGLARAANDDEARQWLSCFGGSQAPRSSIQTQEVQTLLLHSPRLPFGAFIVIDLGTDVDRRRAVLRALAAGDPAFPAVSFGEVVGESRGSATLGFTAVGLERLGLPPVTEADGLAGFPFPFVAGMRSRSSVLGDARSHPRPEWRWDDVGSGARPVDALLILLAADEAELGTRCSAIEELLARNEGAVVHSIRTSPPADKPSKHDHFGFRDGISQPAMRGTEAARRSIGHDIVQPGEFLLGYEANSGYSAPALKLASARDPDRLLPGIRQAPEGDYPVFGGRDGVDAPFRDFGRNGSFLAVRQLVQDVHGFERETFEQAAKIRSDYPWALAPGNLDIDARYVGAKMVGRWQNGTPLTEHPTREGGVGRPTNDFSFGRDDPHGMACPLGAHVRRANPRDGADAEDPIKSAGGNRHRILRRGRHYTLPGDGGPAERGLIFAAFCGDIERQFEFIQQNWLNAPGFNGLEAEVDPLSADHTSQGVFSIPTARGPIRLRGLSTFVTAVGGGYFFVPSRAALRYLGREFAPKQRKPCTEIVASAERSCLAV